MTRLALHAVVYGNPAPQGSKKAAPIYRGSKAKGTRQFTGRVAMREDSPHVEPWRQEVEAAIRDAVATWTAHDRWEGVLMGPVEVRITFTLRRGTTVRRPWPAVFPDLDKIVRATFDGITKGGAWKDDALAVRLATEKLYAGTPGALERPGAVVELWTLDGITPAALAASTPA